MADRKRVSLKGKGADIFFGDYQPAEIAEVAPVDLPVEAVTEVTGFEVPGTIELAADEQASKLTSKQASLQESKKARRLATAAKDTKPGAIGDDSFGESSLADMWEQLSVPATITNAFRYTDEELSSLADAVYELTKQHRVRLTKQEIARLGLNLVLWDYRTRGEMSLLSRFAQARKRPAKTA